jgi:RNA recognition motif-containing protein
VSPLPGTIENTTVFVGNLDPSVTEEQLGNHFQGFGTIVQIKIPPNRGCGFVKFETREAAEKALATLHGSMLSGLRIRLDWGKASAGRQHAGLVGAGMDPSMTGYSALQAHQYYLAQWQAQQQAQAAYYYRYGGQSAQMYVMPQQHIQQPVNTRQQPGAFTSTSGGQQLLQQQQFQQQPQMAAGQEDTGGEFSTTSLTSSQQRPAGMAWNDIGQ